MRCCLLLLVFFGWVRLALAQAPPSVVTDTATLHFMRWYLSEGLGTPVRQRLKLYCFTTPWREVIITTGDTATDFPHKLALVHSADTIGYPPSQLAHYKVLWKEIGLSATYFSRADLAAMRQQYGQETSRSWPASLSPLELTSQGPNEHCVKAFTLPLFSLDGRRALLWQFDGCPGCAGARLLLFERTPTGRWRRRPEHLAGWIE